MEIDSRFASVFTNKDFAPEFSVDKRGRQMKKKSGENLARYYRLEGGDGKERSQNSDGKQRQDVQPSAPKMMAKKKSKEVSDKGQKLELSSGAAIVSLRDRQEEGVEKAVLDEGVPHKVQRRKQGALLLKPPLQKEEEVGVEEEKEEEEEEVDEEDEDGREVAIASSSSSSDDDSDDEVAEEEEEVWWPTEVPPLDGKRLKNRKEPVRFCTQLTMGAASPPTTQSETRVL